MTAAVVHAGSESRGACDGGGADPIPVLWGHFRDYYDVADFAGAGKFFVRISSHNTYPVLVAIYSAVLGVFVPSGGSKWIIEAPYVMQAAKDLGVNLGWVVQIYNAAEALPNLVNPFWMLPLLGILKARARDLVGYGLLQLVVHSVLVLFLMWFFARTMAYVPPVLP